MNVCSHCNASVNGGCVHHWFEHLKRTVTALEAIRDMTADAEPIEKPYSIHLNRIAVVALEGLNGGKG